ncbi:hypothetical protein BJY52DRAFT_1265285 [Lactarius psammicola]|nr:hypothetical protein BJY52DRAFT_1265285 [Lactarius psammicola]
MGINKPPALAALSSSPNSTSLLFTSLSNCKHNDAHENHPRNFSCCSCPCRSGGSATGGLGGGLVGRPLRWCVLLEPIRIFTSLINLKVHLQMVSLISVVLLVTLVLVVPMVSVVSVGSLIELVGPHPPSHPHPPHVPHVPRLSDGMAYFVIPGLTLLISWTRANVVANT